MRILALILFLPFFQCGAQCDNCEIDNGGETYCWGSNKSETQLHMTKLMDSSHQNLFNEALVELNWMLNNAPCLNICLYVGAERLVKKVLNTSKDKKITRQYEGIQMRLKELKELHFAGKARSTPCWNP